VITLTEARGCAQAAATHQRSWAAAVRWFGLGLGLILGFCAPAGAATAEAVPAVLVIQSYHEGMPWVDSVARGLETGLKGRAELYFTHLDIKRFPGPAISRDYEAYLTGLFKATRPAVLVTVDDAAYQFALGWRERLHATTPVVFGGVNFWPGTRPAGVGGVLEAYDLAGTLQLAMQLHPGCRRIVVVNDATETGRANRATLDRLSLDLGGRKLVYTGEGTFAETGEFLQTLNPEADVVVLLSWNLDATGATCSYETAIGRAHALSRAPIYGVWDFYFGHGIVGGSLLAGETHGEEIAALVGEVLQGKSIDALPIVTRCRTQVLLDARELRRFGVAETRWPADAGIRFRPPSLWREYRGPIIAISVVLLLQGVTIAWLVVARASRRRAVARLRASEANLRRITDSIHDGLISTDAASRITLMNPMAERLTGWTQAEALGQPLSSVLPLRHPETGQALPDAVVAVLHDTKGHGLERARLDDRHGTKRLLAFSLAPVRGEGGGIAGAVLAFHDITELRRLEEQFRQSQKMESIGLLAGGIAHDFNNLLQVIYGNLHFLADGRSTAGESAACHREIEAAAQRASDLTRQLLAFSRRQKLAPQKLDLALLTGTMLKMVRRILGANIEIVFAAEPGRFLVEADPSQLEQVVLNLCVNARDAMPDGGRLELTLSHASFSISDMQQMPWIQPGRYVQLSVSDNGAGMDRETQARIFEPFFTTKPDGHGTGLGLAVVQGIVQQHEGLINVYSEPGAGTTFRVYLPALDPAGTCAPVPAASPGVRPPTRGQATVLLAEDDTATRTVTSLILRRQGYTVIAVADGEEACAAARRARFDVAILDVMMPRLGGPDAARRLTSERPDLPIILCSGHPGILPRQSALPAHWHWLNKPYPGDQLLALLDRILHPPA